MRGYRPIVAYNEEVYGPTVQVIEEMRLGSLCTVDGAGGAHCVSK